MRCHKCQSENPDTKRFCRKCGTKLVTICPNCKSDNDPEDSFCGDCGHGLTLPFESKTRALSFDEKIARIQKYLPSGITEKALSQRNRIEGEKRQVTVMCCDMKARACLSVCMQ